MNEVLAESNENDDREYLISAPVAQRTIPQPTAPQESDVVDSPTPRSFVPTKNLSKIWEDGKIGILFLSICVLLHIFAFEDPPTYEQATTGNNVDGETFQPRYPVYRRQTSYSNGNKCDDNKF